MTDEIRLDRTEHHQSATRFLAGLDPEWAALVVLIGPCQHDPKAAREPYEVLVRAIAYQQLHAKAGDAILARLKALAPSGAFPTPDEIASLGDVALRGCGFSATKAATIQAIAFGTINGLVPGREEAERLADAALIDRLTTIKGIGRWTVEMLLIYSLQRLDVMPADDFGAREGYRRLTRSNERLTARLLRERSEAWSPYRTVAAWYLWRAAEQLPGN